MNPTPEFLDLETWPRRASFEHFRRYAQPHVNVCLRLDAAPLKAAVAARGESFALACHFVALRLAQAHEGLRLRIEGGRVRVLPEVHASTTVLRDDASFGFVTLRHDADWTRFHAAGRAAMAAARSPTVAAHDPEEDAELEAALMHFTVIPWLHFSSLTHPRSGDPADSVPKLAFGQALADGERLWLPVSLEVHHGLMDGLHLGQYLQDLQRAMREPGPWLGPGRGGVP